MSEFNKEITYLLTHRLFDSSTTNASPARCILIKRKFGTPAVLKFRYTYIRVTWLRHDALRTSVTTLFRLGELGLGPLGGLRLGELLGRTSRLYSALLMGETVRFTKN